MRNSNRLSMSRESIFSVIDNVTEVLDFSVERVGNVATLDFTTSSTLTRAPRASGYDWLQKPVITFQTPGVPTAGELATFSMPNYYSPHGVAAGTHIYHLYIVNPATDSKTLIYDSSLNGDVASYTFTTEDGGRPILRAFAVDANGRVNMDIWADSIIYPEVAGAFSEANLFDHIYDSESSFLKVGGAAAATGEEVDKWVDRNASGFDLTWNGEVGATRATRRADNAGLVLTETTGDQAYQAPDGAIFSPIPYPNHVMMVLKNTGDTTFGFIWKNSSWNVRLTAAGDIVVSGGTTETALAAVPNDGNFYIVEFEAVDGTGVVRVNGVDVINPMDFNANGVRSVNLGDNSTGNQSKPAHYAGIYLKKGSTLTSQEAAAMRDSIATRYGITL